MATTTDVTVGVRLPLGTDVRWWNASNITDDEHDGESGVLCRDGEDGPIVVRFPDGCQRYAGHGELEITT